ncbi:MAG: hypothetical protein Q9219_002465 [cf. Caloplaca sp. 3 TL-2023]
MNASQMDQTHGGSRGYAGIHRTILNIFRFLTSLELVDIAEVALEDLACAICNNSYDDPVNQPPARLVRLPCGHLFDRSCLLTWLTPLDVQDDTDIGASSAEDGADEDDSTDDESDSELEEEVINDRAGRTGQPNVRANEIIYREETRRTRMNRGPAFSATLSTSVRTPINANSAFSITSMVNYGPNLLSGQGTAYPESHWILAEHDPAHEDYEVNDGLASSLDSETSSEDDDRIAYRAMIAGKNTCPLCRTELFPKAECGDSTLLLRVRIRAWDLAYKYTGVRRNVIDEEERSSCLAFIHEWDSLHLEKSSISLTQGRRMLQRAAKSLVEVTTDPKYSAYHSVSEEEKHDLREFGRLMRFRVADMPVWFGSDKSLDDVGVFDVWYGPDDDGDDREGGFRRDYVQVRIKDGTEEMEEDE